MTAQPCAIGVTRLSAGYWRDEPVLTGLAMRVVGPGWFQLTGPNGTGKSTLFEVLAGYLEPFAGDVFAGGRPVRPGRRAVGIRVVRADPAFVPGVTMRDHLHLYARRYGADRTELVGLAIALGLEPHLDKAAQALSTGSLKKAWLVCNAAGDEPVWCLDEPFNGVDAASARVIVDLIAQRASRSLVLFTGHLLPPGVSSRPAVEQFVAEPFGLREVFHA